MNAVVLPLLGEPPDAHSLLATKVVRYTLSPPRGVSESFAAQGRPLWLSGAFMLVLVLSRLAPTNSPCPPCCGKTPTGGGPPCPGRRP